MSGKSPVECAFDLARTQVETGVVPFVVLGVAGADGIATKMEALAKSLLADDGQLQAKTDGLNARIKDIGKQQTAVDTRIAAFEARTRAQFTALDSIMSKMSTTSSYLAQQLARL